VASIPQFLITIGVVAGYFISYGTVNIASSLSWRLPFVMHSIVAFTYMVLTLLVLPQSPRWLTANGRNKEAIALWEDLGVHAEDREKDEDLIVNVVEMGTELTPYMSTPGSVLAKENASALLRVFAKDVRGRTLLGMFLNSMQQLSGIDGVLYVRTPLPHS
jgi:hypothetical protein